MTRDLPSDADLDRATDPQYAAVCALAVVGLVIAVLGVSAFVAAPLVAAPLLGLVFSLAALRQIRRSHGVLTGRRLAVAGLVVGAGLTVFSTGHHLLVWRRDRLVLNGLREQALEVTDQLLAGRYEEVYERMPQEWRVRQASGPWAFRARFQSLFEGAGSLVRRGLSSLRTIEREDGSRRAPAQVEVEFRRRVLQVTLIFAPGEDGNWELIGAGAEETFESMMKFSGQEAGTRGPPPHDEEPRPDETPSAKPGFRGAAG